MVKELILKYERHISAASILLAFTIDSFTLVRLDQFLTIFLLVVYLLVVGAGIIRINLREAGKAPWLSDNTYLWLIIAVQFSFGGLFGRFLIYYSRSGSLYASWPFLLLLAVLLIGNEFAKKYYSRLSLQVGFFFLTIFGFMIFFVPIILGQMGPSVFIFSGLLSLAVFGAFIHILLRFAPSKIRQNRSKLLLTTGMIYALINIFYFANMIPPIPLALREADVYHYVMKAGDVYNVTREETQPFDFLQLYPTVHIVKGQPVYVYTAVFAPTNFDTSIVHQWQYYSDESGKWVDDNKITFPIVGGSDRGYRGYTIKSNISAGLWRVSVETTRGQIIGSIKFAVEYASATPPLVNDTQ
jgi:hypothetical protein